MVRPKSEVPPNRVKELREAQNLTMAELGELIGVEASRINKIEKRIIRIMPDRALALAKALGVTMDDLYSGDDGDSTHTPAQRARSQVTEQRVARGSEPTEQIPVMGSAAGSLIGGKFQIIGGPVDYIDRPPALQNARGIYALYIDGNSMEPMFRHGSICVVSEYKPPRVGDVVIVQEQKSPANPVEASIGILETRNGEKVVLRKLNPDGKIELPRQYITAMHKVLDYAELLGI